nr:PREDICTED: toll-like receptor 2 type-2 isoform X1 [Lepisosteus oculatus]
MSSSLRVTALANLLLCVWLTLVTVPATAGQFPCPASDGVFANCKGANLEWVPAGLPLSVEVLDLSYNRLRAIRRADFAHLSRLRDLRLQYNNISHIEGGSFLFNALLEHLNIFNNSLRAIPHKALQPLVKLRSLDMSNNLYAQATLDDVFSAFTSLESLSLGGPLVQNLSRGDFRALQKTRLVKFAIKAGTSLVHYEPGTLVGIQTREMWLDIALDDRPEILPNILRDFAGSSFACLRFRNLFEFKYYTGTEDIFLGLRAIKTNKLVFYRGKFNENLLRMALLNIQGSPIKGLELVAVDFARSPSFVDNGTGSSVTDLSLDELVLSDISNPDILRFDWRFTWFSKVRNLTIRNVNFNFVPCDAWDELRNVEVMTIANNRLRDNFLYNQRCTYKDSMPSLRTFDASANELTSLSTLTALMGEWRQLRVLDLSYNKLGSLEESCTWRQNITKMILHHNTFDRSVLDCLPTTLEYLDLSYSSLDQLDMTYFQKATSLRVLLLSDNKIKFIPSGWSSPSLWSLVVDGNSFGLINTGSFHNMPSLALLRAGNNPYHCTCDLHHFFQETLARGTVNITDWPDDYICYHPEPLRMTSVDRFSPGRLACDVRLVVAISVVITAIVVLVIVLLCYAFDVPWYAKATYQILRARYRARQEGDLLGRDFAYHAFVSYSHSDAEWVRDQLLLRLESCEPPYRVCIHERDFMPGRWIIDNIIENIENSRKVIFVLSHHFVNSEWCNYELYFAQQRAIGKTFQDVILVVKEAIDPDSLPSKYCRLKKMLSTKTYLEWPEETQRRAFFWAQLCSVLGKPTLRGERQGSRKDRSPSSDWELMTELPLEEEVGPSGQAEAASVSQSVAGDLDSGPSVVQVPV